MPTFAAAFPVMEGKEAVLHQWCKELRGKRLAQARDSLVRHDVERESWFLQKTLAGNLWIVIIETPDIERYFRGMVSSQDPFDAWIRNQIKDISGFDLTQPGPPPPEEILHFDRGNSK